MKEHCLSMALFYHKTFSLPEELEDAIHSPEYLGVNSQSNVDADEAIYNNETCEQKLVSSEPPPAHRPIS